MAGRGTSQGCFNIHTAAELRTALTVEETQRAALERRLEELEARQQQAAPAVGEELAAVERQRREAACRRQRLTEETMRSQTVVDAKVPVFSCWCSAVDDLQLVVWNMLAACLT